ncbi:MAG: phage holin family protein [Candidatus Promineifilaceae bacterium]|nr:phage holin family protein [Candidatus Promineifilaceae bacterium]
MTLYSRPTEPHYTHPPGDRRTLGDLFSDLSQNASFLARQEIQLAKVEMKQKATEAGKEVATIAIGGLLANAALLALIAALILGLSQFMAAWLAAFIVTVVVAIIAALLIWKGVNTLKAMNPAPEQTITTLQEDKEWLTHQINQ